ncbi:MAG TPA: type II toxin-antitoxin system PemK/MazF family toxin [Peptococcaceae bacterium]|jgi:mRNA interferase MazF|nr:type II toxin-antitoxin system PemK/MazF family toxin [Clostridia bacterium]HOB82342.1 type II toxin-antitoxin system PemK/MazF family toxin [Peptococcaceae bacterium]HPZ71272.1 type II toxin-antitoxin system PemK/MazF family toxin [Peptococcaceae bacterium]HQD54298.1 type II toxin-antitoxin system PemK/MazF family toxin [Peptococcaceae bacterium]
MSVKRGDIFYAELNPVIGSEQGGTRPVLVIQNDIGNQYSPTTIVAAITSQLEKAKLPTHVELTRKASGLEKNSVVLLEQIRTIDKQRLKQKVSSLDEDLMEKVDDALRISLALTDF